MWDIDCELNAFDLRLCHPRLFDCYITPVLIDQPLIETVALVPYRMYYMSS